MEINDDLKFSSAIRMTVDWGTTKEPCKIVWLSNKMIYEIEWRKILKQCTQKKSPSFAYELMGSDLNITIQEQYIWDALLRYFHENMSLKLRASWQSEKQSKC